jgi:phage-related protein
MTSIGAGCYELRVLDDRKSWRIIYHVAEEAIVILHVFEKKSRKTPKRISDVCRRRLRAFSELS